MPTDPLREELRALEHEVRGIVLRASEFYPSLAADLLIVADELQDVLRAAPEPPRPPDAIIPPNPDENPHSDAPFAHFAAAGAGTAHGLARPLDGDARTIVHETPAPAVPRVKASELRPVSRRLLELVLEVDALDRELETRSRPDVLDPVADELARGPWPR